MGKTKTSWNLKIFFDNLTDKNIERNLKIVTQKNYSFINKWQTRTDYLENPEVLARALKEYETLETFYGTSGDAGYYISLMHYLDQANPQIKAKAEKIEEIEKDISNNVIFFEEKISKIPVEKQQDFLTSPSLQNFRHLLKTLFRSAKYLLTESEEKIINILVSTSYSKWVSMVSEFISKESANVQGKTRNFAELSDLLSDREKGTRDDAAKTFNKILEKHVDVAEHEVNAILKYKKEMDQLRGFARPDSARHVADDIETEVVDSLLESVQASFDISKRYYELKAKLMGVPKLKYHERNVPLGKSEKKYSFEEAYGIVSKTLKTLDPEFYAIINSLTESGNIDVFPKEGKQSGAFCVHNLKSQPIFIFLNHTDRLEDIITLAHECGHAIHFELAKQTQNSLNTGASLIVAEVASTFVEDFVLNEIYGKVEEEEQLWLIMQKLNDLVSTLQRQTACYLFELEIHKKFREIGYLSKEQIGEIFTRNMQAYMGDFVETSQGAQNWWVYWSHIRRFFYVYSYSSGVLISMFLQRMVREDAKNIQKIKTLLSKGSSESPTEMFESLGIDITTSDFWNEAIKNQRDLLNEAWKLSKNLGKL